MARRALVIQGGNLVLSVNRNGMTQDEPSLKYIDNDVQRVSEALEKQGFTVLKFQGIASELREVLDNMDEEIQQDKSDPLSVIYYTGHCSFIKGAYNLFLKDGSGSKASAIYGLGDLISGVLKFRGKILIFLDCCNSWKALEGTITRKEPYAIITSTNDVIPSVESDAFQMSVFTKFLVDALTEISPELYPNGLLTPRSIFEFIRDGIENEKFLGNNSYPAPEWKNKGESKIVIQEKSEFISGGVNWSKPYVVVLRKYLSLRTAVLSPFDICAVSDCYLREALRTLGTDQLRFEIEYERRMDVSDPIYRAVLNLQQNAMSAFTAFEETLDLNYMMNLPDFVAEAMSPLNCLNPVERDAMIARTIKTAAMEAGSEKYSSGTVLNNVLKERLIIIPGNPKERKHLENDNTKYLFLYRDELPFGQWELKRLRIRNHFLSNGCDTAKVDLKVALLYIESPRYAYLNVTKEGYSVRYNEQEANIYAEKITDQFKLAVKNKNDVIVLPEWSLTETVLEKMTNFLKSIKAVQERPMLVIGGSKWDGNTNRIILMDGSGKERGSQYKMSAGKIYTDRIIRENINTGKGIIPRVEIDGMGYVNVMFIDDLIDHDHPVAGLLAIRLEVDYAFCIGRNSRHEDIKNEAVMLAKKGILTIVHNQPGEAKSGSAVDIDCLGYIATPKKNGVQYKEIRIPGAWRGETDPILQLIFRIDREAYEQGNMLRSALFIDASGEKCEALIK